MFLFEKPIAHRGLHGNGIPENSMTAFRLATEKGYNIETDVHLLKTGEVVVFHDNNLKRVCGINKKIKDMTLDDIKGNDYLLPNGEHIPLFSEMIDAIDGKTGILLELKFATFFNNNLEKAVYDLIKGKEDWIAVQSFGTPIMKWFRQNAPEFYNGILSNDSLRFLLLLQHKLIRPDFISYGVKGTAWASKFCNKNKYKLLAWTVNSQEAYKLSEKNKVDNVIFEKITPEEFGYKLRK